MQSKNAWPKGVMLPSECWVWQAPAAQQPFMPSPRSLPAHSQPLAAAPSQSKWLAAQLAMVQLPAGQAAVAFARLQTLEQLPQWATSLALVSQPSSAAGAIGWLQS